MRRAWAPCSTHGWSSDRAEQRRAAPASAEGRWSLVSASRQKAVRDAAADTQRATALARQLLARYGLVPREVGAAEEIPGGFSAVYEVLRTMEETGKIRRGYFVAGVAAMQFALPSVLDMLRALRDRPDVAEVVTLLSTDPANPYGALLPWPTGNAPQPAEGREKGTEDGAVVSKRRATTRTVGSHVILVDGALVAWVGRGGRQVTTFLPVDDPDRSRVAQALAGALAELSGAGQRRELLLNEIDDAPAAKHPLAAWLLKVGFVSGYDGLQYRPPRRPAPTPPVAGRDAGDRTAVGARGILIGS